jgi:hypothetical protein
MESSKNNGRPREQLSRASMIGAIAAQKSYNQIVQKMRASHRQIIKQLKAGIE